MLQIVLGHNRVPHSEWKKQTKLVRTYTYNEMAQDIYVENLKEANSQEFVDSKQDHYRKRYNNVRLEGNDLELYLRQ